MSDVSDKAVQDIHHHLDGTGFLGTISNSDLHDSTKDLTQLSSADANDAVSQLSDDDLKKLADGGMWNELSDGEKRDFLNEMAGKLGGDNLAKLGKAFGYDAVADAVLSHGTPNAQADYVAALAPQVSGDAQNHIQVGGSSSTYGNDQAQAAAKVLAGLSGQPSAFNTAVNALSSAGKLDDVMKTALGQTDNYSEAAVTSSFKPDQLVRILNAAATTDDPAVKAKVFEEGGKQLKTLEDAHMSLGYVPIGAEDGAKQVAAAMGNVLKSDTNGVIHELDNNAFSRDGHALSAYFREMVKEGNYADIADVVHKQQTGNDGNQNVATRLGPPYDNAKDLGYVTGAIEAGIKGYTNDAAKQAAAVGGIFNAVITATAAAGPGATVASAGMGYLTSSLVNAATDSINGNGDSLSQALSLLAYPHDESGVSLLPKDQQTTFDTVYDSARSRVKGAN